MCKYGMMSMYFTKYLVQNSLKTNYAYIRSSLLSETLFLTKTVTIITFFRTYGNYIIIFTLLNEITQKKYVYGKEILLFNL